MFGFFTALTKAHGKKALSQVNDAIVAYDPATASAAQLEMMEADLDKVGKELASLRAEAIREQQEEVAVRARFDRMRAAGDTLLARYNAEEDPAKKTELENSLNGLLTTLEEVQTELAQEAQEAVEATALVNETETLYREKAEALKEAKKNLTKAARDLERAKVQEARADAQAERAARVAGLRDNEVGGLNAALTTMQRQAADARGAAESKRLKAQVLSKADHGSLEDPNVIAALASVSNAPSALPFADRLKALSGPSTPVAAPLQIENKSTDNA